MAGPMPTGELPASAPSGSAGRQRGVSYLWVLVTIALLGLGSALAATIFATDMKREREAELIRVGREFRAALLAYYAASPGAKQFPRQLEDLLQDARYPSIRRYLRRVYADPMTGKAEWGTVRLGDQIVGVYSLSQAQPLKIANFEPDEASFSDATDYTKWVFLAEPPGVPQVKSGSDNRGGPVGSGQPDTAAGER